MIWEIPFMIWEARCALCPNSEIIMDLESIKKHTNAKQIYIDSLSKNGDLYNKGWRSVLSENLHYCPECIERYRNGEQPYYMDARNKQKSVY